MYKESLEVKENLSGTINSLDNLNNQLKEFKNKFEKLNREKNVKQRQRAEVKESFDLLQEQMKKLDYSLVRLNSRVHNLNENINRIVSRLNEQSVIKETLMKRASYLNRMLINRVKMLKDISNNQLPLLNTSYKSLTEKKKKYEQDRVKLNRISKQLPMLTRKLSIFSEEEADLKSKKSQVTKLYDELTKMHESKLNQKKMLEETLAKIKNREKNIEKLSI